MGGPAAGGPSHSEVEALGPAPLFRPSLSFPGSSSLSPLPSCSSVSPCGEGLLERLLQPLECLALTLWLGQLRYFSVSQSMCVVAPKTFSSNSLFTRGLFSAVSILEYGL